MKTWFLRLDQREQLSLLLLTLVLGLYLLYMLVWSPLDSARDQLASLMANEYILTIRRD